MCARSFIVLSQLYSKSVSHQFSDFCNHETTDEGMRGTFQWNKTEVNTTAVTSCFYGPAGVVATRLCVASNTWATPSVDQCKTVVSEQFSGFQQVNSVTEFITE